MIRIQDEDAGAAQLVMARVDRAIAALTAQPGIGTLTARPGVRRFAIPATGHAIEYRLVSGEIRILRWSRQRQR
ncbi:plasmid stabilization system protein ParE [Massilia violacea]|uniref:Plasmid stabilization system protein ParE n=2 Tax=Pseudoduganella violacea TaxID=1715466 RepID=A0A7W5BB76_9BURK|nr:hypothetical protein [Pseudoduganella violacea]MBB3119145.1 plasmid stabilization system protein ParE [Pseudoduganella violacea]